MYFRQTISADSFWFSSIFVDSSRIVGFVNTITILFRDRQKIQISPILYAVNIKGGYIDERVPRDRVASVKRF